MLFLSIVNAFDAVIQFQVCILIHGFGGTIRGKAENPKSKLDMIVSYVSRLNLQKSKCKIRVRLCIMDLFDMFFRTQDRISEVDVGLLATSKMKLFLKC